MKSNFIFSFIGFICTLQPSLQYKDGILCRSCGADISSIEHLFSKAGPKAYNFYFNDTLLIEDVAWVEILLSDTFPYHVVTFHNSTCVGVGEWEEEASWYPGYLWKPCVCPECAAFIGCVFQPVQPGLIVPSETFYGLLLRALVSESFVDSLIDYTKL